jgi:multiple sugar transport system ATP-binding protein
MAEVTIRDLTKAYGAAQVIHGLNLDIPDGAFVVLVGPSGCGKSTLLRMIAGLEGITGGTIRIGPRVVNNLPPSERDIAMVFQNYALYPHKTVAANMGFALKMRGLAQAEIRAKVERAADVLGLTPYLDRYPRALSGGQRQRVAIARALVKRPALVIADEPTANLDSNTADQVLELMREQGHAHGASFLVATHDDRLLVRCDRVLRLLDGRIAGASDQRLPNFARAA